MEDVKLLVTFWGDNHQENYSHFHNCHRHKTKVCFIFWPDHIVSHPPGGKSLPSVLETTQCLCPSEGLVGEWDLLLLLEIQLLKLSERQIIACRYKREVIYSLVYFTNITFFLKVLFVSFFQLSEFRPAYNLEFSSAGW